nr:MAG: hypothetical protein [Chemarfal virus 133]
MASQGNDSNIPAFQLDANAFIAGASRVTANKHDNTPSAELADDGFKTVGLKGATPKEINAKKKAVRAERRAQREAAAEEARLAQTEAEAAQNSAFWESDPLGSPALGVRFCERMYYPAGHALVGKLKAIKVTFCAGTWEEVLDVARRASNLDLSGYHRKELSGWSWIRTAINIVDWESWATIDAKLAMEGLAPSKKKVVDISGVKAKSELLLPNRMKFKQVIGRREPVDYYQLEMMCVAPRLVCVETNPGPTRCDIVESRFDEAGSWIAQNSQAGFYLARPAQPITQNTTGLTYQWNTTSSVLGGVNQSFAAIVAFDDSVTFADVMVTLVGGTNRATILCQLPPDSLGTAALGTASLPSGPGGMSPNLISFASMLSTSSTGYIGLMLYCPGGAPTASGFKVYSHCVIDTKTSTDINSTTTVSNMPNTGSGLQLDVDFPLVQAVSGDIGIFNGGVSGAIAVSAPNPIPVTGGVTINNTAPLPIDISAPVTIQTAPLTALATVVDFTSNVPVVNGTVGGVVQPFETTGGAVPIVAADVTIVGFAQQDRPLWVSDYVQPGPVIDPPAAAVPAVSLMRSGDVEPNPGPVDVSICSASIAARVYSDLVCENPAASAWLDSTVKHLHKNWTVVKSNTSRAMLLEYVRSFTYDEDLDSLLDAGNQAAEIMDKCYPEDLAQDMIMHESDTNPLDSTEDVASAAAPTPSRKPSSKSSSRPSSSGSEVRPKSAAHAARDKAAGYQNAVVRVAKRMVSYEASSIPTVNFGALASWLYSHIATRRPGSPAVLLHSRFLQDVLAVIQKTVNVPDSSPLALWAFDCATLTPEMDHYDTAVFLAMFAWDSKAEGPTKEQLRGCIRWFTYISSGVKHDRDVVPDWYIRSDAAAMLVNAVADFTSTCSEWVRDLTRENIESNPGPNSGWVRDLTREGVEPNPGPGGGEMTAAQAQVALVTSASTTNMSNPLTWESIAKTKSVEEAVIDSPVGGSDYMDHKAVTLNSFQGYGNLLGQRRQQMVQTQGINRISHTDANGNLLENGEVCLNVSPLVTRAFLYEGALTPFSVGMPQIQVDLINAAGYSLEATDYTQSLYNKAQTGELTNRTTAISTKTFFSWNNEYAVSRDLAGIDFFNPEQLSIKAVGSLERLAYLQPDAAYSDVQTSAILAGLTSPGNHQLNRTFLYDRSQFPVNEQYGYTVGAGNAITPSAVCGRECYFTLHSSYETTALESANTVLSGGSPVPIQVSTRLANVLGPNKIGRVLAILGELVAYYPVYPVGYVNDTATGYFTHRAENMRIPGEVDIRFYLPSDPRTKGNIPGSVVEATNNALYQKIQTGGCTVNNMAMPFLSVGPLAPVAANTSLTYVAQNDPLSTAYSLTGLWASYMNSDTPITMAEYLAVIKAIDNVVPISPCMKFMKQLMDSRTWMIRRLKTNILPDVQTPDQPYQMTYYDGTVPRTDNGSTFCVNGSLLKPFSRMLGGFMAANPAESWAGTDRCFDGPINYTSSYFPNYGWATVTKLAAAHQLAMYLIGRSGDDINEANLTLTNIDTVLADYARALDGTNMQMEFGMNTDVQITLAKCYSLVTGGKKLPHDLAAQNIFMRRYIQWSSITTPFANSEFIPGALDIAQLFFIAGQSFREFCPFPTADVLNKSVYLPMGTEYGVLSCSARDVGTFPAPLYPTSQIQSFNTYTASDSDSLYDATLSYNIDLWNRETNILTGQAQAYTSKTSTLVVPQLLLFSQPIQRVSGSTTLQVEARGLWPRKKGNEHVVVYNAGAPTYNDLGLIGEFVQQVTQPRKTWIFTPMASRPNNVFVVGGGVTSRLRKIATNDRKLEDAKVTPALVPVANGPVVLNEQRVTEDMALNGGPGNAPFPIGVMASGGITNSNIIPSAVGSQAGIHGMSQYPTLTGEAPRS